MFTSSLSPHTQRRDTDGVSQPPVWAPSQSVKTPVQTINGQCDKPEPRVGQADFRKGFNEMISCSFALPLSTVGMKQQVNI